MRHGTWELHMFLPAVKLLAWCFSCPLDGHRNYENSFWEVSKRAESWRRIKEWAEGSRRRISDPFFTQHFQPSSSLTEGHKNQNATQQTSLHSKDKNITSHSKLLHKPNIGHIPDCSQWVDLKPSSWNHAFSGPYSLSRNPQEIRSSNVGSPQLPAKPQVQYLDYLG